MAGSKNTQITVAVISLLGILGTAIFANWDKIFPPDESKPSSTSQSDEQNEAAFNTAPTEQPEAQKQIYIQKVNTKARIMLNWPIDPIPRS